MRIYKSVKRVVSYVMMVAVLAVMLLPRNGETVQAADSTEDRHIEVSVNESNVPTVQIGDVEVEPSVNENNTVYTFTNSGWEGKLIYTIGEDENYWTFENFSYASTNAFAAVFFTTLNTTPFIINWIGNNTIYTNGNRAVSLFCYGNLILNDTDNEGTLHLISEGVGDSCSIYAHGNIYIENGNLDINSGCLGIFTWTNDGAYDICISGGNINCDAAESGIYSDAGDVTITGGTIHVITETDECIIGDVVTLSGGEIYLLTSSEDCNAILADSELIVENLSLFAVSDNGEYVEVSEYSGQKAVKLFVPQVQTPTTEEEQQGASQPAEEVTQSQTTQSYDPQATVALAQISNDQELQNQEILVPEKAMVNTAVATETIIASKTEKKTASSAELMEQEDDASFGLTYKEEVVVDDEVAKHSWFGDFLASRADIFRFKLFGSLIVAVNLICYFTFKYSKLYKNVNEELQ